MDKRFWRALLVVYLIHFPTVESYSDILYTEASSVEVVIIWIDVNYFQQLQYAESKTNLYALFLLVCIF